MSLLVCVLELGRQELHMLRKSLESVLRLAHWVCCLTTRLEVREDDTTHADCSVFSRAVHVRSWLCIWPALARSIE